MFCYKCGKRIEDDAVFCSACGTKVNNAPVNETGTMQKQFSDKISEVEAKVDDEVVQEFEFMDEIIAFRQKEVTRLGVEVPFRIFAFRAQEALGEFLSTKVKYFDGLYNDGFGYYIYALQVKTVNLALRVLRENGVDYIDAATLTDRFFERFDIEGSLDVFCRCKSLIEEWIEKVQLAREYERGTRAKWSGGGFGIKGAIKGAINAAVLNFGTDMVHSISDSRVDAKDKKELAKRKKEVYEECNIGENMKESLYDAICAYGTMVYEILVEEGIYEEHIWQPKKATGKYVNLIERSKKEEIENDEVVEILCDCIRLWPFIPTVVESLHNIVEDELDEEIICEIAEYLGFSEMLGLYN